MLMRRILTISKAAALGANIGLEHLVLIEGRLSVCGKKCFILTPPNYSTTLLGWQRGALTSLSASQPGGSGEKQMKSKPRT